VLWERLKREGRLLETDNIKLSDWHNLQMNFVSTRPMEQIFKEFVRIHQVLYEPGNYLDRAFGHFARMGPSPFEGRFKAPNLFELRVLLTTMWKQGVIYSTRKKFWKLFFMAATRFSRDRFAHFIRALVKLERYLDRREELSRQLGKLTN